MATLAVKTPFQRTRFTYLAYILQGYFGMVLAMPGALMPYVADQLGLTYGQMGLHFTMSAGGGFVVGLLGQRLAARTGNRIPSWGGFVLGTAALFGVVYGANIWLTLASMLLVGIGTGSVAQFIGAAIVDAHPQHQPQVLTEGNIMAGVGVGVAPLVVGLVERFGPGWQFAPFAAVLVVIIVALTFWNTPFPPSRSQNADADTAGASLPLIYWMFGALIFLAVAMEWLLFYWSPNFLSEFVGLEQSTASALISVQAAAIVIGRLIGRRLLAWISEERLLMLAFVWVLAVFPVYLFSPYPALNVVGLFLLGLGIGNAFPLCLTGAMMAGGDQTGRASAGVTLMGSLSLIIMPNLVGNLADYINLRPALMSVAVLALVAVGVTATANRMRAARL